jgi:hypothetical protein
MVTPRPSAYFCDLSATRTAATSPLSFTNIVRPSMLHSTPVSRPLPRKIVVVSSGPNGGVHCT